MVLEGAKVEFNDTDGSYVGNGYTRYDFFCEFIVLNFVITQLTLLFLDCASPVTFHIFVKFDKEISTSIVITLLINLVLLKN